MEIHIYYTNLAKYKKYNFIGKVHIFHSQNKTLESISKYIKNALFKKVSLNKII